MKPFKMLVYIFLVSSFINLSQSSADTQVSQQGTESVENTSNAIKSQYEEYKKMIEDKKSSVPTTGASNDLSVAAFKSNPTKSQDLNSFDVQTNSIKKNYENYSVPGKGNLPVNSLFSSCLSSYLQGLAGGSNPGGCNQCYKKGYDSKSQLAGVTDPTINSVIVDPNSDTVNPVAWNSLPPVLRNIILEQNPEIAKAINKSVETQNIVCN